MKYSATFLCVDVFEISLSDQVRRLPSIENEQETTSEVCTNPQPLSPSPTSAAAAVHFSPVKPQTQTAPTSLPATATSDSATSTPTTTSCATPVPQTPPSAAIASSTTRKQSLAGSAFHSVGTVIRRISPGHSRSRYCSRTLRIRVGKTESVSSDFFDSTLE